MDNRRAIQDRSASRRIDGTLMMTTSYNRQCARRDEE